MKERIQRGNDERIYQPRIHSDQIRELYALKQETGLPMTCLVALAIRNLIREMRDKEWIGRKCQCGENVVCRAVTNEGIKYLCHEHFLLLNKNGGIKFQELSIIYLPQGLNAGVYKD